MENSAYSALVSCHALIRLSNPPSPYLWLDDDIQRRRCGLSSQGRGAQRPCQVKKGILLDHVRPTDACTKPSASAFDTRQTASFTIGLPSDE